ncbi:predicted protein [Heterostelium album PN500]|uniref:Fungal lipase-type domain-containing protein n=1 Tax=Heterostelium pallidum (strain ATCC 26659 / Pp 5 / PN500) TaxID=670386 RepID=D3B176_HETP5|nr:predicted protein [Heterostelium album PN500]EFA85050.1 predicted protein [Heterostelium album PN500]|eukprot:XP_020437160.1 predicted protein [Heterostelium album PN500]
MGYNGLVMSYSAYCFNSSITKWGCPASTCDNNTLTDGFFKYDFSFVDEYTVSDSLFYIAIQESTYYLVFRGTDNKVNAFEDFDFLSQAQFPKDSGSTALVSKGFYDACLRDQVLPALKAAGCHQYSDCNLMIFGHSFGGAMATLAALDFSINKYFGNIGVYTYGSPRVGNQEFAELFDANVPNSFRVVYLEDTIPHLPLPAFELLDSNATYLHVNTEVWINEYNSNPSEYPGFVICPENEQLNCSTGSFVQWTQFDTIDSLMAYHRSYFDFNLEVFCHDWTLDDLTVTPTPIPSSFDYPVLDLNVTSRWYAGGYNYSNVIGTFKNNGTEDIVNPVWKSTPNIVPIAVFGLTHTVVNDTINWHLSPGGNYTHFMAKGSSYTFAFAINLFMLLDKTTSTSFINEGGNRGTANHVNELEDLDFIHQAQFPKDSGETALVSQGFYDGKDIIFKGLREPVISALKAAGCYQYNDCKLMIVGHCFGGVSTYGSPRVGNQDFTELFKNHVANSIRVVYLEDTIPHLPLPAFDL